MNALEKRAAWSLASIFGLRIFGLFLILPVFALFAHDLHGATPALIGLTLGAYGLTQALLQIPFGLLSDRWGRKRSIALGLIIFAIGSLIAASADSIYGMFIGRMIQGAGAISAAVIALLADLTRDEQRTKAMAMVGISIGFIFMLSMMLGPLLDKFIGVRGIFLLTAAFALLAIAVLYKVTPSPIESNLHRDAQPVLGQISDVLADAQLRRLDFGIFALHAVLTALFVVVPFELIELGNLPKLAHWKIYVPVMLLAIVGTLPFLVLSHRKDKIQIVFLAAIALLATALLVLALSAGTAWEWLLLGLVLFFAGFNALEAMLPSLISQVAPAGCKGTATGVYNSAQFFGVFIGGTAAGSLSGQFDASAVFWFCLILALLWLAWVFIAPAFVLYDSQQFNIGIRSDSELSKLKQNLSDLQGVIEVSLTQGETTAYLKVDKQHFDSEQARALIGATN